jgi:2-haloacid dehalogenase
MPGPLLNGIRACVFDAYGTLFDVNTVTIPCLRELGDKADSLNRMWREKQLQYSWLRAAQGRHADFWQVTGDALDFAFESLGFADPVLRTRAAKDRRNQAWRSVQRNPRDAAKRC